MAGDNGQIPPEPVAGAPASAAPLPGRRRLGGALGAAFAVALVAVLLWRLAVNLFGGGGADPRRPATPAGAARTGGDREPGTSEDGLIQIFDRQTGRLTLRVRFKKAAMKDELVRMESVDLERVLDERRGRLLATARQGVYHMQTNSGSLAGEVVVRRLSPGREEPDLVIRTESLKWDHASGVLATGDRADVLWIDPRTGRKLTASGTGVLAERLTQKLRFDRDARVSLTEAALPGRLPLAGKGPPRPVAPDQSPPVTVITCSGPATFENEIAPFGERRITFTRAPGAEQVAATRPDLRKGGSFRLNCDRLEVYLAPERAGPGRASPALAAVERSAAGPLLPTLATAWLERSAATAVRGRAAAAADAGSRKRKPGGEEQQVDAVAAHGAVKLSGPEGTARGEHVWYDRPAGLIWLDGEPGEPAEVVRDGNQILAPGFLFDVITGEMTAEEAGGRGKIPEGRKDR